MPYFIYWDFSPAFASICCAYLISLCAVLLQSLNSQLKAMLKVIGKKEEQLQVLKDQQTHMQTTITQLEGDAKESLALRAADRAAKAYAADLQAKVTLLHGTQRCCCDLFSCITPAL